MKRLLVPAFVVILLACGDRSGLPGARALSPEGADHRFAGMSPDGSRIYWWQQEEDGRWHLYAAAADMRTPERLPLSSSRSGNIRLIPSPDGSRLAVPAAVNSAFESVWLLEAAGGEPRRVTPEDALAVPLQWHPDGRRLMYLTVVEGSFYTMVLDLETGAHRRVLPAERRPHFAFWSPDASRLAVMMFDQGRGTIWLADGDGGNLRAATTEGLEVPAGTVSPWSPDGSALLYTSRRTGTSDVWVLPVDGSAPRQLTSDVRDDDAAEWSPDGRWVVVRSNRGLQDDLWVVPASGGEARRVTDDAAREDIVGWRPGTSEVLYTVSRQRRTLWAHSVADGAERQLTHDSLDVTFFNLSGAGQVVVALSRGGGVTDAAVLPLAGGDPRIILRDARGGDFYWSPDGSRLVFTSDRAGPNADVWVMDSAGGGLRQLTSWPETEDGAFFSADGSHVVFRSERQARWGDLWRVPVAGGEPERLTDSGLVLATCWQLNRPGEVVFPVVADTPVTVAMMRLRPGGGMQTLWDRTTASFCAPVSPTADSIALLTSVPGGGFQTMLLPLDGRAGRRLLEPNQQPIKWSPDGRRLLFTYTTDPPFDLGILDLADGTVRRVTTTPASEQRPEWSHDGSTLVFRRVTPVSRITTADVRRLVR